MSSSGDVRSCWRITLDHADPSRVVLSRTIGRQNEVELRRTRDHGATWQSRLLTSGSRSLNIRPVIPRGLGADPLVVLYVTGSAEELPRIRLASS